MQQPVKRRHFLQCAATTLAAPMIVRSTTLGAPVKDAPSNRITIGMIGMGRQASAINVRQFLDEPDTQVVAVCDVDAWRLDRGRAIVEKHYAQQTRAGTYQGCAAYKDFRELLDRTDIDAVMISTPDHWHVPIAMAAAKAGKDICCEKPLTRSIHEGRLLSDLVTKHQCVFRTDSEARSKYSFHRAAELVRNGAIGRIQTIRVGVPQDHVSCGQPEEMPIPPELDYNLWLGPAAEVPYTENRVHPRQDYGRGGWMRVSDYSDGMITNWGAHMVDIAQWGNNSDETGPVEIEATGHFPQDELWNVLQNFEVHYRYADGVHMVLRDTKLEYVRFEGTEGWVSAGFGNKSLQASDDNILQVQFGDDALKLPHKPEKRDFIDCVKLRQRTQCDAEIGHRTNSVCLLGKIAVEMGTRLQWDPNKELFVNHPAADKLLSRTMRAPWTL